MDDLTFGLLSSPLEETPVIPRIIIDKGKRREDTASAKWGRDELVWSDISDLITKEQSRTLVCSSQNVIIASLPADSSISPSSILSGLPPSPRLRAFPLPTSPSTSTSPRSFSLPLPSFPLPHLSPTYLSISPSAFYLIAFFPLSGPSGQGGTLAVWEITGRGKSKAEWEIKDTWAVPGGKEVVDIAWLGVEREWVSSATHESSTEQEEGIASSSTPKFYRLPPLGPPLPSHSAYFSPPTFLILTTSHEVVLHHPSSSTATDKRWPLRTIKCGISGPEFGVWGLTEGASIEGAAGTSGAQGGKTGRRVRRGKILVRGEDPSVYLVVHSTVLPPQVPSVPPMEPLAIDSILGSLGIGIGDNPSSSALESATPVPSGVGEDPSGDEPWIEVIECKIDLLGAEATISALPFPPIHFASPSINLDQSTDSVPSSAVLSHLSFVELADFEATPSTVELSPKRDLGIVATFFDPSGDSFRSDMHLWMLKKEEVLLSDAFLELESKPTDLAPPSNAFDWHASHVSRRIFNDSVVTSIESMGPESLGLVLIGEVKQTWVEGVVGKLSVLKLSDLSTPAEWSATDVMTRPGKRTLPLSVASSSNSALVASFDTSLCFHAHPTKAGPFSTSSSPTEWSSLCDELATSLGLSLFRNADPSDLIRLVSEGSRKRGDVKAVDDVLRKTWDALVAQQEPVEPFGDSEWLLPLMEVQRRLYDSLDDPRAKIAEEVLRLASINASFSGASVEGRNGEPDSFQIDSIWKLISETYWVLADVGDLLRLALLQRSWSSWMATTSEDLAPVARLLIFLHPTTRDLLQSLLSQISAFATFVSTTLASPILGSPDSANTHVRSLLSTELAKNRLKDVVDRSGLNLERMGEALETLAGAMMSGELTSTELDPPLLSLSIPPLRFAEMQTLSAAISKLPARAASKVLLLWQLSPEERGGGSAKRRKVEVAGSRGGAALS